jgi:hypothetical protein
MGVAVGQCQSATPPQQKEKFQVSALRWMSPLIWGYEMKDGHRTAILDTAFGSSCWSHSTWPQTASSPQVHSKCEVPGGFGHAHSQDGVEIWTKRANFKNTIISGRWKTGQSRPVTPKVGRQQGSDARNTENGGNENYGNAPKLKYQVMKLPINLHTL